MNFDWLISIVQNMAQAIFTLNLAYSLLGTIAAMHVIKLATMRIANALARQEIFLWSIFVAYPITHRIYGGSAPIPVEILSLIVGVTGNMAYAYLIKWPMQKWLPETYKIINGDRRIHDVAVEQDKRTHA